MIQRSISWENKGRSLRGAGIALTAKDNGKHNPSPNVFIYDPPSPGSPQVGLILGEKHR